MINQIIKGDCLEETKKLQDNYVDLIILDPPYGNIVKENWDKTENPMNNELACELFRILKPTGNLYCWCGIGEKSRSLLSFINILDKDFYFKDLITWKKNRGIGMRKGWLYTREEILWYVKDNKQFQWNVKEQYSTEERPWHVVKDGKMVNKSKYKRYTNVWTDINECGFGKSPTKFKEIRKQIKHVSPKPVEAIERIIKLHTNENDIVYDCFGGSGTTAVAAIRTNRQYILVEKYTKNIKNINIRIDIENEEMESQLFAKTT